MILRGKLENKLQQIEQVLSVDFKKEYEIGILAGLSGIAIFHYHYYRHFKSEKNLEVANSILELIFEKINSGYQYPTYCSGIAGACWAIDYLNQNNFIDVDCDDLLSNFDEYLHEKMLSDVGNKKYDLLHESFGYGYYFLNRYKNTSNEKLKQKYVGYLSELINFMTNTKEEDEKGVRWHMHFDPFDKVEMINLSLAHGNSGLGLFLCELLKNELFVPQITPFLRGLVNYLENVKFENNDYCLYPEAIKSDNKVNEKTRLGWCYGDFGIALLYWNASEVLKDQNLYTKSIEILKHASQRRGSEQTKVFDSGFCHGAFGNAHIFNQFYKKTEIQEFLEAAEYWLNQGLSLDTKKSEGAGYMQWDGISSEWVVKLSLLEGISGIGLVMMDSLSKEENNWDKSLFLNI